MLMQPTFNIQVVDSEVVEELPRPCDAEAELAKRVKEAEGDKHAASNLEYFKENYRPRRLKQPHIYVRLVGEAAVPLNAEHAEMMFGKYKGQKLLDVPEHYLEFIIRKGLEDAARYTVELRRRKALARLTKDKGFYNGSI